MNVLDYLKKYKDVSFKEMAFNEIDALAFANFSYVDFNALKLDKEKVDSFYLARLINDYQPNSNDSERKLNYLKIAKYLCEGKRYNKARFAHFRKIRDTSSEKQFQAITILFMDFIYISYCGTDATTLGWKEDCNMAILNIVPSEIEAIKYANMVMNKHWFRPVYLGGHSKGGRLAITAAKGATNKKRIAAIFSFDAPNYPLKVYDAEYKKIDSKILAYAPNESIIGRLMNEYHQKRVVKSTNSLLFQHDSFSWLVDDKTFDYDYGYSEKSTRIVHAINHALMTYDEETKRQFIDFFFDGFEKMNLKTLPNENEFISYFAKRIPSLIGIWKGSSKENRSAVKKIAFDILKDYFFSK